MALASFATVSCKPVVEGRAPIYHFFDNLDDLEANKSKLHVADSVRVGARNLDFKVVIRTTLHNESDIVPGFNYIELGETHLALKLEQLPSQFEPNHFGYSEGKTNSIALLFYCADKFNKPIYIPTGEYLVNIPLGPFHRALTIKGDGPTKSILRTDNNFVGWLLEFIDTGFVASGWKKEDNSINFDDEVSGVTIQNVGFVSNSKNIEAGCLKFCDRNDNVIIQNVYIHHFSLGAFVCGICKVRKTAYLRESVISNLSIRQCGSRKNASMTIQSDGIGDASNQIDFYSLKIIWPNGPGLVIKNFNDNIPIRRLYFYSLMLHGKEERKDYGADLLAIKGDVTNVIFANARANANEIDSAAISLDELNGKYPRGIDVHLDITTGYGDGVRVFAGQNIRIWLHSIFVEQTGLIVGESLVGPLYVHANLNQLTTNINQTTDRIHLLNF